MEQRHLEYIEYYKARLRKYENNPLYPTLYQTEKALHDAIASCEKLEDFKAKVEEGQLPFKNAKALMKDQETAWEKHYLETKEFIRAKASTQILAMLDDAKDLSDVITRSNEIRNKNNTEISIDGFATEFYSAFTMLENIEVWERAEVPSRWKSEIKENIQDSVQSYREIFRDITLTSARLYDPGFRLDADLAREERYRRLIPVKDQAFERRLAQFKAIIAPCQ
jgi:hypothetical protein